VIIVDTHVVIWLAFDQAQLSKKGEERNRRYAREGGRLGNLRHYTVGVGDTHEKGPAPARHQSRIFPAGNRSPVRRSANHRPSVRARRGSSSGLPQRSCGSHYRSDSTCRGAIVTYCRPRDPSVQSGSHDLVRSAPSSAPGMRRKICGPSPTPGTSRRASRSLATLGSDAGGNFCG
jgi:hypothetical protein